MTASVRRVEVKYGRWNEKKKKCVTDDKASTLSCKQYRRLIMKKTYVQPDSSSSELRSRDEQTVATELLYAAFINVV